MYSDTIRAFHPAPQAVMLPVRRDGTIAGNRTRRQYVLPRRPNDRAASWRSPGIARTPAIRLNNRYHCMLNNAMRMAESSAAGPSVAVTNNANPTIIGNRAVAGRDAATSSTGVRYLDPRGLCPIQAANGIVQASEMPYAMESRTNEDAAARGSSEAPAGSGARNSRASPMRPATTTKAKTAPKRARSKIRISRSTRGWAGKVRSRRTEARRYFVTTGWTLVKNVRRSRGNRGSQRNRSYGDGNRGSSRPVVSIRNRSDHTPRGRQTKVSRATTTAARTPIPIAMPALSPTSPAFAMKAPRPGRVYVPPKAVNVSLATRKNQPLLHDRIGLYTSFGIAAGKARRRNRSIPRRPKLAAAASRSTGTVVNAS